MTTEHEGDDLEENLEDTLFKTRGLGSTMTSQRVNAGRACGRLGFVSRTVTSVRLVSCFSYRHANNEEI